MQVDHVRERTRTEHEATEALMPLASPELSREQYATYLGALHTALSGWEAYAAVHASADLAPLVAVRRRAGLLEDDLRFLGATPEQGASPAGRVPGLTDTSADRASFLGAMYVVEGSSLGGQYLARHLDSTLGLTPESGASYFAGYREKTGPFWAEFKAVLAALPDSAEDQVVAAARAMFDVFATALRAVRVPAVVAR